MFAAVNGDPLRHRRWCVYRCLLCTEASGTHRHFAEGQLRWRPRLRFGLSALCAMRPVLRALVLALLGVCASAGRDFYKTLDIARGADDATVKRAYRNLAKKWHPDKNPGAEEAAEAKFREVGHPAALAWTPGGTHVEIPACAGRQGHMLPLPEAERC